MITKIDCSNTSIDLVVLERKTYDNLLSSAHTLRQDLIRRDTALRRAHALLRKIAKNIQEVRSRTADEIEELLSGCK